MLARDLDGASERFLGGDGIGRIALEQHFAARPMQFRFERAMAGPLTRRQRFIEDGDGAVSIARPRLGFSQRNLDQSVVDHNVLFAQEFGAAEHVLEPAAGRATLRPRQAIEKDSDRRLIVIARESGEFDGVQRGA